MPADPNEPPSNSLSHFLVYFDFDSFNKTDLSLDLRLARELADDNMSICLISSEAEDKIKEELNFPNDLEEVFIFGENIFSSQNLSENYNNVYDYAKSEMQLSKSAIFLAETVLSRNKNLNIQYNLITYDNNSINNLMALKDNIKFALESQAAGLLSYQEDFSNDNSSFLSPEKILESKFISR